MLYDFFNTMFVIIWLHHWLGVILNSSTRGHSLHVYPLKWLGTGWSDVPGPGLHSCPMGAFFHFWGVAPWRHSPACVGPLRHPLSPCGGCSGLFSGLGIHGKFCDIPSCLRSNFKRRQWPYRFRRHDDAGRCSTLLGRACATNHGAEGPMMNIFLVQCIYLQVHHTDSCYQ